MWAGRRVRVGKKTTYKIQQSLFPPFPSKHFVHTTLTQLRHPSWVQNTRLSGTARHLKGIGPGTLWLRAWLKMKQNLDGGGTEP